MAEEEGHRLYRNFASKLVDLWRVEGGVPVREWITTDGEMEIILDAWARGGGVRVPWRGRMRRQRKNRQVECTLRRRRRARRATMRSGLSAICFALQTSTSKLP